MKQTLSIQERLKDLRIENHLKLEELAEKTGISKSALGSYENDDYKEINHGNIVTLAKFYGVSTDYLLCLTDTKKHPNTELTELHLDDKMVELLKSGNINNRLLSEIATHKNFIPLMADAEIYVDGIATMRFQDLNATLEVIRSEIIRKYQPQEGDSSLKTLEASQIQEEDYFLHITHKHWDSILHDIRKAHENDIESAPDSSNAAKMIKDVEKALQVPGNYLDMFVYVMCNQLQIHYMKLSEKERSDIKSILKKSPIFKNSALVSRKKR